MCLAGQVSPLDQWHQHTSVWGLWGQSGWVQISVWLLISCVALDEITFSKLSSLFICEMGRMTTGVPALGVIFIYH